jgi:hypothetical protein
VRPPAAGAGLAIDRYDTISEKKLIAQLHQLSPEELLAVEEHELTHQARPAVLEKLGYVRQGGADATIVDALRAYERKGRSTREELDELAALAQEARYHRERLELYRAKLYGGRAVSEAKLRELERAAEGAEGRLKRARDARGGPGSASAGGSAG